MSVIAWDGHVLAADSACFHDGRMYKIDKLFLTGVVAFAYCGIPNAAIRYRAHGIIPSGNDGDYFHAISVNAGRVTFIDSGVETFHGMVGDTGTTLTAGQPYAVGLVDAFLDAGWPAHQAIAKAIAMRSSDSIFGPVKYWYQGVICSMDTETDLC